MERNGGKILLRSLCLLLVFLLVGGVSFSVSEGASRFFEGEAEEYYRSLLAVGFPEEYAAPLTELHLLHPSWSFVPLLITEGCSQL